MRHALVGLLVIAPSVALAQSAGDDVLADSAARSPGFVTLDRGDAVSRLGIEASYLFLSAPNGLNASYTALRFEAHGQYVDPGSGLGGYVQTPLSYLNVSPNGAPSTSGTGVGNLEVGALFVPHLAAHGVAFVLRLGLTLPTASTLSNGIPTASSIDSVYANGYGSLVRLADNYLAVPDATSLRASASVLLRSGVVFARADLGADTNLSSGQNTDVSTQLRLDIGAGVAIGAAAVTVESTNIYVDTDKTTASSASGWYDTGALAARFGNGPGDVYVAVVMPLNHASHEPYGALLPTFDAALTLGVEGRL
jgi:hypothetical protein